MDLISKPHVLFCGFEAVAVDDETRGVAGLAGSSYKLVGVGGAGESHE